MPVELEDEILGKLLESILLADVTLTGRHLLRTHQGNVLHMRMKS